MQTAKCDAQNCLRNAIAYNALLTRRRRVLPTFEISLSSSRVGFASRDLVFDLAFVDRAERFGDLDLPLPPRPPCLAISEKNSLPRDLRFGVLDLDFDLEEDFDFEEPERVFLPAMIVSF